MVLGGRNLVFELRRWVRRRDRKTEVLDGGWCPDTGPSETRRTGTFIPGTVSENQGLLRPDCRTICSTVRSRSVCSVTIILRVIVQTRFRFM